MYENGFGVPQAYDVAADLYHRAAAQGDPFAQSRLGLIYDKGHGVPQNVVLSYKWLDLAAAHATKRERDFYLRLRNAVASKMSSDQIVEGQRLGSALGTRSLVTGVGTATATLTAVSHARDRIALCIAFIANQNLFDETLSPIA